LSLVAAQPLYMNVAAGITPNFKYFTEEKKDFI